MSSSQAVSLDSPAESLKRALGLVSIVSPTKRAIVILMAVLTVFSLFSYELAAQEPQSTKIAFKLLLDDLIDSSDRNDITYIRIQVKDDNRPSEMTKQIILGAKLEVISGAKVRLINVNDQVTYPLTEMENQWFIIGDSRQFALTISDITWPNDAGTILFQDSEARRISAVIFMQLEPRTYRVTAYLTNRNGTKEIANFTQGYAEGKTTEVSLTQPSRFANLWEKVSSSEGILAATIAALVTILVGVLKDNIKAAFNKLLDFLGKYFGGRLAERRFVKRYLENIIFNHKYLKLIGFNTTGISRPLLEEVFVSLRIASTAGNTTNISDPQQTHSTIPFNSAFRRYRCMVILGGPGAGKTTTLSYALLAFAKNNANQQLDVDERLLPIYVPLRRLSNSNRSIIEDVTDKDTQILSAEILKEYPANYFEGKLKKGQCLLLLDGLDEVLDEKTQRQIAERINSLVAAYPKNRFVVTCRTAGWKNLLSGEFTILSAQDFDRDEIQRFVLGWHKAVITQSEYSRLHLDIPDQKKFDEAWEARKEEFVRPAIDIQSRNLIHAIDSNNRILAIAVNPMLLSLISLVHFNRQFLPRGRTVLYSQCLDLLMDAWDRTRDILSPATGITAIQKEAVLREIAFDFQTRGKGEDSRENLERLIASIALKLGISISAKDILQDIETRSGLLTERSLDVFGFSHLTLQEYLVAKHIQLNPGNIELLAQNFDNQGWREVILLYTGLVANATDLIKGVAASDSLERQTLAGYCVGDAQHCDSDVTQTIIDRLLSELIHHPESVESVVSAIAAIAADYQANPLSVEERLSAQLIKKIEDKTAPVTDRLQAIAIMGNARVTRALPSLLGSLHSYHAQIAKEAIKAIVQFGNLALPAIEQFLRTDDNEVSFRNIVSVLGRINTGSSALVLIKAYNHGMFDSTISIQLATMMTNPLVETELLQLDIAQLPAALRQYPRDGNSWNYRSAKNGFLFLDAKMRNGVLDLIENSNLTWVHSEFFRTVSFKILFPAFLAHLRSLPKTRIKGDEQVDNDLEIFDRLGFDQTEPNKLRYLVNQIQTQYEMPLDLALQRIASTNDASNVSRPKRYKLWSSIANVYFVLVYLGLMIFGIAAVVNLITYDILQLNNPVALVFPMSVYIAGALLCIFLILITKRKLKKRVFSRPFVSIALNPIRNFLKVLPYISRYKPTTQLIVFQSLVICLSPFCPLVLMTLYYGVDYRQLSWSSLLNPFAVFVLTLPFLFVILSRYYWKHRILAENPVIELIAMHPQGRRLIGDTI